MPSPLEQILESVKNLDLSAIEKVTGHRADSVDEFMARTQVRGKTNYGRGLVAGLIGGLVGAGVKMLVDRAITPDQEHIEDKAAAAVVEAADLELTEDQQALAETVVELGMGALVGGLYGLLVEAMPEAQNEEGAALWTTTQQVAAPLLGLAPAAMQEEAKDRLGNLAGHVAFGTTVEIVRRGVRYAMEEDIL
jgi:uncharacterized membrane protein YagU involved in acid resistance